MNKLARYKGNIAGALIGAAIGVAYVYYAEDGGTTVATALVVSALIGGVLGWLAANLWKAAIYRGNIAGAAIGAAIGAPLYGWANYADDGGATVLTALVVGALFGGVLGWLAANRWKAPWRARVPLIAGALIGAALLGRWHYSPNGWAQVWASAWWGALIGGAVGGALGGSMVGGRRRSARRRRGGGPS